MKLKIYEIFHPRVSNLVPLALLSHWPSLYQLRRALILCSASYFSLNIKSWNEKFIIQNTKKPINVLSFYLLYYNEHMGHYWFDVLYIRHISFIHFANFFRWMSCAKLAYILHICHIFVTHMLNICKIKSICVIYT